MAATALDRPLGRWSIRSKIAGLQMAGLREVANHVLPLVRRSADYSLLTKR
jgi:hypothetical protein